MKKLLLFLLFATPCFAQSGAIAPQDCNNTTCTATKYNLGSPGFSLSGGSVFGQWTGSATNYYEFDLQNTNSGSTASTDLVINSDNATNTTHYLNLGKNSSGFTGTGSLNQAGYGYLYTATDDLVIGTLTSNAIHVVVNNGSADSMIFNTDGSTQIPGNAALRFGTTGFTASINYDASGNTVLAPRSGYGWIISSVASDAANTDNTLCYSSTTTGLILKGSGTLGICLGTSSKRFKHNIAPLTVGLHAILTLQPKSFYLDKAHGDPKKLMYGFIAEEAPKELSALVGRDTRGRVSTFDYLGVVPVLVKAVQEQQVEIAALQNHIKKIESNH